MPSLRPFQKSLSRRASLHAATAAYLACFTPAHAAPSETSAAIGSSSITDAGADAGQAGAAGTQSPAPPPAKNVYKGNYFIVAAGGGFVPTYEGSRHRSFTPAVGIMGRIGPISFSPRAAGLAMDFIPDHGHKFGFALGPSFVYNLNRHSGIDDPVVQKLGTLTPQLESGIAASVSIKHLLTRYDSLSLSSDIRWGMSGRSGRIIAPSLGYYTPVNRGMLVTASVFGQFISKKYADYYYSVSQEGAQASGLPLYNAHAGPKQAGAQAAVAIDLDGNLLNGGWALLVGTSYTHLAGSAAQTPITTLRGTVNQWVFGGGIAYSF